MSWFEAKHAWADWRAGRWHDYPYAKPGELLYRIEMRLRRRCCDRHGHRFYPGPPHSWKTWCRVCFEPRS